MRRTDPRPPRLLRALPLWLALLASMALCNPIAEELGGALPGEILEPEGCPGIPAPDEAERPEKSEPPSARLIAEALGSAAPAGEV